MASIKKKLEGYVCNNKKCRGYGSPLYFEYEGKIDKNCKYCTEEMTDLTKSIYKDSDVKASDIMPTISTSGFTCKPRTRY